MYLINQHSIEINCQNKQLGHEFKNDISTVLELDFYPKLEKLLKKYDDIDTIWSIDHLPIELNNLDDKEWKPELVSQSLRQIELYLKEHALNRDRAKKEVLINKWGRRMNKKEHIQELVIHFIKTGVLKSNVQTASLQELYSNLEINTSFIKYVKDALKGNIQAILRWSFNMPKHLKFEFLGTDGIAHDLNFAEKVIDRSPKLNDFLEFLYWVAFFNEASFMLNQQFMKAIKNIAERYYSIDGPYVDKLLYQKENDSTSVLKIKEDLKTTYKKLSVKSKEKDSIKEDLNSILEENIDLMSKTKDSIKEVFFIDNSGLVLLNPFLPKLFAELEYQEKGEWKDVSLQHRAALLLQYLVEFNDDIFENNLMLNKILCGIPVTDTVHTKFEITNQEKELSESLLKAVIEHWKVLKNTSVSGLQESFIQRSGKLIIDKNDRFQLTVDKKGYDILLDQLPWGIGMIKTPWMEDYLTCNWN